MKKYQSLSTLDLLGRLIGTRAAKQLYRNSLSPLFAPEIPQPHHDKLLVARELVHRWLGEEIKRGPVVKDAEFMREYLRLLFAEEEREIFAVVYLDSGHAALDTEFLFFGTLTGVNVHPREIVKGALQRNAAAVILAHNHPSGSAEPSEDDQLITRRIQEALSLLEIRLLDHFVVGGATVESFAERGLL